MTDRDLGRTMPLHRRLEHSSIGVVLGGIALLVWGLVRHSDDTTSAGISALVVGVVALAVLRLAGWSRDRRSSRP